MSELTESKINKKNERGLLDSRYIRETLVQLLKNANYTSDSITGAELAKLLEESYSDRLTGSKKAFEDLLTSIRELDEGAVEDATQLVQMFLADNFTHEELYLLEENRDDRREAEEQGGVLNDLCHVLRHDHAVSFHILAADKYSPDEVRTLIKNAFTELARRLEQQKDINEIHLSSWLVMEYPKVVERLGFDVDDERTGFAKMSRNNFIDKWGNNKTL